MARPHDGAGAAAAAADAHAGAAAAARAGAAAARAQGAPAALAPQGAPAAADVQAPPQPAAAAPLPAEAVAQPQQQPLAQPAGIDDFWGDLNDEIPIAAPEPPTWWAESDRWHAWLLAPRDWWHRPHGAWAWNDTYNVWVWFSVPVEHRRPQGGQRRY